MIEYVAWEVWTSPYIDPSSLCGARLANPSIKGAQGLPPIQIPAGTGLTSHFKRNPPKASGISNFQQKNIKEPFWLRSLGAEWQSTQLSIQDQEKLKHISSNRAIAGLKGQWSLLRGWQWHCSSVLQEVCEGSVSIKAPSFCGFSSTCAIDHSKSATASVHFHFIHSCYESSPCLQYTPLWKCK